MGNEYKFIDWDMFNFKLDLCSINIILARCFFKFIMVWQFNRDIFFTNSFEGEKEK